MRKMIQTERSTSGKPFAGLIHENSRVLYLAWITLVLGATSMKFQLEVPYLIAAIVTFVCFPDFLLRLLKMLATWHGGEENIFLTTLDNLKSSSFVYAMVWVICAPVIAFYGLNSIQVTAGDPKLSKYALVLVVLALLPLAIQLVVTVLMGLRTTIRFVITSVRSNTGKPLLTLFHENRNKLYVEAITLILALTGLFFQMEIPTFIAVITASFIFPKSLFKVLAILSEWKGGENNIFKNTLASLEESSIEFNIVWSLLAPLFVIIGIGFATALGVEANSLWLYEVAFMGWAVFVLPFSLFAFIDKLRQM